MISTFASHARKHHVSQVSNLMRKLAPLNYSASAPATLREDNLQAGAGDPLTDLELNARPGSGRILLADDISQATLAKRSRCVNVRPQRERFKIEIFFSADIPCLGFFVVDLGTVSAMCSPSPFRLVLFGRFSPHSLL